MTQLSLTLSPGVRRTDPDTCHLAAAKLRGHDRIVALLIHSDHPNGLTDFELGVLMRRQQTSAGKRRGELRDLGLIVDADHRRLAPSGSPAIVWRITETGRAIASLSRLNGR